ncbi:hypothetical protein [Enterobacter asburiae]|uniref:hypothetical protein n=1 Tax=Enterobacter asburiae TaxID=61645 RepID=UPI00192B70FF|nr:hypothetical protein [Enterobacter asburiae]MBL5837907.1 hypothetical protein [Enterobacter asburiae]MBL5940769.1 hypothetical protein [Enterobacter asburiae]MBL5968939.1 hypothetical protein [Enterobacter asburiae]
MEKIISLISEKENLILLLSCMASLSAAFLSLISVRSTIKKRRILKRKIRRQYIIQYTNKFSKVTENELDRKLMSILLEIDLNIEKAKKNQSITYSKDQVVHLRNVMQAIEKIKMPVEPLEQRSQVGKLRYLEKITKDIVDAH